MIQPADVRPDLNGSPLVKSEHPADKLDHNFLGTDHTGGHRRSKQGHSNEEWGIVPSREPSASSGVKFDPQNYKQQAKVNENQSMHALLDELQHFSSDRT